MITIFMKYKDEIDNEGIQETKHCDNLEIRILASKHSCGCGTGDSIFTAWNASLQILIPLCVIS
jgi:hypothetical protein